MQLEVLPPIREVAYNWQCCYCCHGWMNLATSPACEQCGHLRCGSCTYSYS
ncbi:hypothetical protein FOPG_13762 [Fusarium oxysporum f. sp. conglutinans race 2 54008]|uniref:RanBP2-type domain-containing protein n=1 Tax=Fusarium oxysporum f. sp. conglutinans race 2 54008 TaxID=1089457 RepID=X0IB02_FUSOX|nr:hypothetical protein FOPG_13762 [Fusarium oxysporum f. sp. conglutinans race 2 54008]